MINIHQNPPIGRIAHPCPRHKHLNLPTPPPTSQTRH